MPLSTSSPIKIERLKALKKLAFVGSRFQLETVPAFVIVCELPLTLNCSECPVIQDLKRDKLEPLNTSNMEPHADPTCIYFSAEAGQKIKKVLEIFPKILLDKCAVVAIVEKITKNSKVTASMLLLFFVKIN